MKTLCFGLLFTATLWGHVSASVPEFPDARPRGTQLRARAADVSLKLPLRNTAWLDRARDLNWATRWQSQARTPTKR